MKNLYETPRVDIRFPAVRDVIANSQPAPDDQQDDIANDNFEG